MIGFFNCNKPQGVSSAYIVNKIKKVTREKCGHLGTLDPNATGVLPIAVGKATRFFDYFLKKDKVYKAVCKFGVLTTTLDPEGDVVKEEDVDINTEQILDKITNFIGTLMQTPPLYSAKSIAGKRAYEYAKENIQIELEPREVKIYDFKCLEKIDKNTYSFLIHCSAGTYVRSLLLDLAVALGTVSTTIAIDRQASGSFKLDNAVSVDAICENPNKYLISIEDVVPELVKVQIDKKQLKNIADGKSIVIDGLEDSEYLLKYEDKIVCLAQCESCKLKSKIYLYMEEK